MGEERLIGVCPGLGSSFNNKLIQIANTLRLAMKLEYQCITKINVSQFDAVNSHFLKSHDGTRGLEPLAVHSSKTQTQKLLDVAQVSAWWLF